MMFLSDRWFVDVEEFQQTMASNYYFTSKVFSMLHQRMLALFLVIEFERCLVMVTAPKLNFVQNGNFTFVQIKVPEILKYHRIE